MEEKPGFRKFSWLFSIFFVLSAFTFLFAPVLTYKTKVVIDGEKVKIPYDVNFLGFFDEKITKSWPAIVLSVLVFLIIATSLLAFLVFKKAKIKNALCVSGILCSTIAICVMVSLSEIFKAYITNEIIVIENYNSVSISWGSAVSIVFFALTAFVLLVESDYAKSASAKSIAEDAVLIALAFVLDFVKLPIQASGSINFQMLPLMIIAIRRGPLNGFVAGGIVYGLLKCLTEGYGFATYPFDYLVGFGSVAVLGFFRDFIISEKQDDYNIKGEVFILVGGVLSTAVRFIGSTASSMVIYGLDLLPALEYNIVYIPVSGLIAIILLMALYGPLLKINKRYPVEKTITA